MNLKDKIVPKSDFQYSVNIDFDLNSEEKIKGYIPTIGGLNIIEDVMLSALPTSRDRARLFVGAYGKGKSHLVLTILSLLSKKDKNLFKAVLEKAKKNNKNLYEYLEEYISNPQKKLLPVVIQGSSTDTSQTFLLSLKNALSANGLNAVLPDSYFSCAVDTIESWEKNYRTTYEYFQKLINEPVKNFIAKLNMFDSETYQKFTQLYPQLTSGSEFAPTKGLDIVKVYEDVAKKVKNFGYNGLFVVYDEFSKFLENSMGKTSAMEIKMIQDFAELCNRSGENQLHLLLISHKHIQNYISQLPREKVDAWKAVSERFKTIEIHNNFTQTYEIVSTVIEKDKKWFEKFKVEHNDDFMLLQENVKKVKIFDDLPQENVKDLIYNTYPLDFSSLFILPRISELVAQNERTIFTFLASNQKNSLTDFINNVDENFPLLTPDYVYDYFEQLFRNENYNSTTFKIWSDCKNAIAKLESKTNNPLTYKILKTIAVILILQQTDNRLTPTLDTIESIYLSKDRTSEMILAAFKELKQYGAISIMEYNNYISIKKGSDIDIQKLIDDCMTRFKNTFSAKEELNKLISNVYLYPTRYNDENTIVRYFKAEFITDDEIMEVSDWEKKIAQVNADGVVYLILENGNIGRMALKDKLETIDNPRVVFVKLNKKDNINKQLLKIKAIDVIEAQSKEEDKAIIKEELSVYREDCLKIINEYLDAYLRPELSSAIYINCGKELKKVKRKSSISQLLSDICEKVFTNTPKINNELINKNTITPPIFNARNKVLNGLLQNNIQNNLNLTGSGPEINVMRSILFAPGILTENSSTLRVKDLEDEKVQSVLDTIEYFFMKSGEEARSFTELYDLLTMPKYGIALKKGVIPVYIAVILHLHKQHAVITTINDKEIEIKAETLENINKNPANYKLKLENWNEQKQNYISNLDELFHKEVNDKEREYNTFDYIVRAMQRWFLKLNKYQKEADNIYQGMEHFEKLSAEIRKFRNQLKNTDINSRELLFDKLPEIFNVAIEKGLYSKIAKAKETIDDLFDNLADHVALDIQLTFDGHDGSSLLSTMRDWLDTLNKETKNHLLNNGNEVIFNYIENPEANDLTLLNEITRKLSGLRLIDWEDKTVTTFVNALKDFKANVEENNKGSNSQSNTGLYKIVYVDENGNEEVKTLTKQETSSKAKLFNNEIHSLMEDYGQSLTTNEKRQVLFDILKDLK